jgi:hypothetical protein
MVTVRILYPKDSTEKSKLFRIMEIPDGDSLVLPPLSSVIYPEEWSSLHEVSPEPSQGNKEEKAASKEKFLKDAFKVTITDDMR